MKRNAIFKKENKCEIHVVQFIYRLFPSCISYELMFICSVSSILYEQYLVLLVFTWGSTDGLNLPFLPQTSNMT